MSIVSKRCQCTNGVHLACIMDSLLLRTLTVSWIFGFVVKEVACSNIQLRKFHFNGSSDYFEVTENRIEPLGNGSSISLTIIIKQQLDDMFQVKANLIYNNLPILKRYSLNLCETLKEPFLSVLLDKVESKMPVKCPILPGTYVINDLALRTRDFLPTLPIPSGNFELKFDVGFPNAESILSVVATGFITLDTSFNTL